ncbi:MAG: hypothetical protein NBKEAIPA_00796 [Nitrospirae bacterium]|nr:MAG: hypothetical protein UZ03_NOB001003745 [Nitrospira sp. OLB3]MBV6468922.1 hypothetical protein [Nitrospirota bacterium]MCE7966136.1 hypothetical protein [Nitrospira sp. NTP2]MCK6492916.1 DUF5666 domain-containing protein [Nitrospira sp.]MEB2339167.1 DUF5666 domain-containing protein [Nitrospirales bacterium]
MTALRLLIAALFLIATPVLVLAHGSGQHVLGVISAIDATHIEVKTPKGQLVSVRLTDKTEYKVKNLSRPKSPPQVGDRVVVEAEKSTDGLVATEVHYSDSAKAKH